MYFALLKTIGLFQKRTAVIKEDARKSNSFLRGVVVCVVATKKGVDSMAKKRANGEGSIRKRSDGRWEGRYTAGYDDKRASGSLKMFSARHKQNVRRN